MTEWLCCLNIQSGKDLSAFTIININAKPDSIAEW